MRLIDADKCEKDLLNRCLITGYGGLTSNDVRTEMSRQPTVDAVPVVRCKDCVHKPQENADHYTVFPDEICPCQCEDNWYSWMPQDNFFCAFGERREDG